MLNLDIYSDGGLQTGATAEQPRQMSAVACVAVDPKGTRVVLDRHRRLGELTSNEAEYHGLLLAIETAYLLRPKRVRFIMDSKLVVQQMRGIWGCNERHLMDLGDRARGSLVQAPFAWRFVHVPRAENRRADALVRVALGRRSEGRTLPEIGRQD